MIACNLRSARSKRIIKGPNKIRGIPGLPEIKNGDLVEFRRTIGHQTLNEIGVISFEVEAPRKSFINHYFINATCSSRCHVFLIWYFSPGDWLDVILTRSEEHSRQRWRSATVKQLENTVIEPFDPASGDVDSDDDSGPRRRRICCRLSSVELKMFLKRAITVWAHEGDALSFNSRSFAHSLLLLDFIDG